MQIVSIEAGREKIAFRLEGAAGESLILRESAPVVGGKARTLSVHTRAASETIAIDRFVGGHDRLYSRFTVFQGDEALEGAQFVTDFAADVPENRAGYPQPGGIKALHGTPEDKLALGVRQSPVNINLLALMTTVPGENTIAYQHDGREYYFLREPVEALDAHMLECAQCGVLVTMILLNAPRLFNSTGERALLEACMHPSFAWGRPEVAISAFDMRTEEGQGYYRAFVEFLAERYTRPDGKYGRAAGAIISNEVDSQYIWGNAGEMPMEEYMAEYAQALRQAWLCGQKHCAHFRVYASLDHHWCGSTNDPHYPLRYYSSRDALENLAALSAREGEFPWHVAFHPYPEDLRWPDFWHDRAPDFTLTTPKITFKNMEVLEAYLSQPHMLYRGAPRRIIFSEQGFNSQSGPMQEMTEKMGEAGYVLAYLKARQMKTVDMFMHHAYTDNLDEFGLNLGIRRYDPAAPDHVGEKKPIYFAVRDMDTPQEAGRVAQARAFIGEALFDFLLHPPLECGERGAS